jgi:hypothetical protein
LQADTTLDNVFDKNLYYYKGFCYTDSSLKRKAARGFIPLLSQLVDYHYTACGSNLPLVEIGIGGGGSHLAWREVLSEQIQIIGVELFEPSQVPTDKYNYEKNLKSYKGSLHVRNLSNVSLYYGRSGYDIKTSKFIRDDLLLDGYGVVIDDGDPNKGALNGLVDAWEPFMGDEGIIITEGPFGNGIEDVYNIPKYEQLELMEKVAQEQQMVIFDCSEFMFNAPKWDFNDKINYPLPYIGVWMRNWKNFAKHKPTLNLDYWRKFIVAGEYNIVT